MKPGTPEEAAALLREAKGAVIPRGGGTKPWGPPGDGTVLETGGLNQILEHNVGDFTAVLEAGVPLADLLTTAGLAKSKSEARRLIAQGGAYVDDEQVSDPDRMITAADLDGEGRLLLRAGKKRYHRIVAE